MKREMERRIDKSMKSKQPEAAQGGYYLKALMSRIDRQRFGMLREERFETSLIAGYCKHAPLLDDEIIEYLVRVPPDKLNLNRRSKGLARHMLEKRYPGLGFDTQKKSHYGTFRRQILEQGVEPAWRRLAGAPTLAQLGIVEAKKVTEFAQKSIADRSFTGMYILGLIMQIELWTQKH